MHLKLHHSSYRSNSEVLQSTPLLAAVTSWHYQCISSLCVLETTLRRHQHIEAMETKRATRKARSKAPQNDKGQIQHRCVACNRSFEQENFLEQHLRDAKVHKGDNVFSSRIQVVRAPTSMQSSNRPESSQSVFPETGASCVSLRPLLASNQAEGSDAEQNGINNTGQGCGDMSILGVLAGHCHTPEDLARNKYELSKYSNSDIAGLRKCRKCGSRSQRNIGFMACG